MAAVNIVALIPARGGSKRLPGKNAKELLGKPLINYTIEAALGCQAVTSVYVSTDSPEIMRISRDAGAMVPGLRPPELSADDTPTMAVVQHFLQSAFPERPPEILLLLQPTSPLRTSRHIAEALALYESLSKPCSLVSVTPARPLDWHGMIESASGEFKTLQNLPAFQNQALYQLNGALYCSLAQRYLSDAFYAPPVYPYVMSPETSIDIDTALDFKMAEWLLSSQTAPSA